jgi:hypothetical protein
MIQWLEGKMRDAALSVLAAMEHALGALADRAEVEFAVSFEPFPKPSLSFKVNGKAREILQVLRNRGA